MKKLLLAITLIAGTLTFPPVRAKVCSLCDTNDFEALLKENSNVVVDFYSNHCPPCIRLKPIFEMLGGEMNNVLFITVNVNSFSSLANRYSISSIPALKAFKNGKQVATAVGYKSKTALKKWVTSSLNL